MSLTLRNTAILVAVPAAAATRRYTLPVLGVGAWAALCVGARWLMEIVKWAQD